MDFKQSSKATTVQVLDSFIPTIIISKDALAKMQLYCDLCDTEIGWLGTAFFDNKSTIYVEDVFLFKQDVHHTTTEITPEGLEEFAAELLQQENGLSLWNNLRLWGHSHVNMSTNPSSQDNEQMETFAEGGHDWFLRIIANKKGDITIDLYNYTQGIVYNNLHWWEEQSQEELDVIAKINELHSYLDTLTANYVDRYKDNIDQEIKNKVSKKFPVIGFSSYSHNYNSLRNNDTYNSPYLYTSQIDDGNIRTAADVNDHFDEKLQEEIYKCETYSQAKAFIQSIYEEYTADEIWIIWNTINKKFHMKGDKSF